MAEKEMLKWWELNIDTSLEEYFRQADYADNKVSVPPRWVDMSTNKGLDEYFAQAVKGQRYCIICGHYIGRLSINKYFEAHRHCNRPDCAKACVACAD
jgi:DNA transposition AAA+ family ATPase